MATHRLGSVAAAWELFAGTVETSVEKAGQGTFGLFEGPALSEQTIVSGGLAPVEDWRRWSGCH